MAQLKAVDSSDPSQAVEITTAHIKALRTRTDDREVRVADSIEPGMKLRRDPRNGLLSFIYVGRLRGADQSPIVKVKLGPATDARSISKARAKAAEVRAKLAAGINPSIEKRLKAAELLAASEQLRLQQKHEQQLKQWTPAYALEHMLEWRASRPDASLHLKPETVEFYRRGIGYLGRLASVPIIDIKADAIRVALEKVGGVAKPAKAKRALSGVIAHAIKRLDLSIPNPVTRLDRGEFKAPAPRTGYIKESDIGEAVSCIIKLPTLETAKGKEQEAERARDYLLLMLLYGTRKEELMQMEWSWIDWKDGVITLPASITKQKKIHRLPLTPWTRGLLQRRLEQARTGDVHVFPGQVRGRPLTNVRRSLVRAYGEGLMLHDLRRTLLTHCSVLGINDARQKAMVGHARVGVTENYDQREIEQVRRDFQTYHVWVRGQWEAFDHFEHAAPTTAEQAAADAEAEAADLEWQKTQPQPQAWPGV